MSAGKVAFIAGGSSGIGLASALALGLQGHVVYIGGRSQERLDAALTQLREAGVGAHSISLDTSVTAACQNAIREVVEAQGRIDVLVNSVGSAPAGYFNDVADDAWALALDSKVIGSIRLMKAVTPHMISRKFGRIINIAGTAGKEPDAWMAVAGTANAALVAVTNAASRQLAVDGITVNAVCPGPTSTGRWSGLVSTYSRLHDVDPNAAQASLEALIPRGRPADPSEVASLVAYLASDEARHITGTAIPIDGGQSRSI